MLMRQNVTSTPWPTTPPWHPLTTRSCRRDKLLSGARRPETFPHKPSDCLRTRRPLTRVVLRAVGHSDFVWDFARFRGA